MIEVGLGSVVISHIINQGGTEFEVSRLPPIGLDLGPQALPGLMPERKKFGYLEGMDMLLRIPTVHVLPS